MTPSTTDTSATEADGEFSIRGKTILNLGLTVPFLFIAVQHPVDPLGGAAACLVGAMVGLAFGAVLDRYGDALRQWNDLLVIAVFLVPLLAALYGIRSVASFDVLGYQAIGTICAIWTATLYGLASDSA